MLWPREEFHAAYGQIKHDGIQSGGCSVLILVALDVDALCACEILTRLLQADFLSYTLLPVRGYEDILRVRDARIRDPETQRVRASDLRSIVLVNCGAIVNLTSLLTLPEHIKCYVLDSHRPIHLANIYDTTQQVVVFDDGAQALDEYPSDGSDIENDVDESEEEEDEEELDDVDEGDDDRNDDADENEDEDDGEAEVEFAEPAQVEDDGAQQEENEDATLSTEGDESMSPSLAGSAIQGDKKRKREGGEESGDDEDEDMLSEASAKKTRDHDFERKDADGSGQITKNAESLKATKQQRRETILRYYRGSFNGAPAATIAFELASQMNAAHRDMLWCAIVGLTKQFVMEEIDADNYTLLVHRFQDDVLALEASTNAAVDEDGRSNPAYEHGRIIFEEEYRFMCYRHWSLYEAMYYSDYIASKLGLYMDQARRLGARHAAGSSQDGETTLHVFLARMGLSLRESQQKFTYMPLETKQQLRSKILEMAPDYGLDDVFYGSFTRHFAFQYMLSAADAVHGLQALLEAPESFIASVFQADHHDHAQTLQNLFATDMSDVEAAAKSQDEPGSQSLQDLSHRNFFLAHTALSCGSVTSSKVMEAGIQVAMQLKQAIVRIGLSIMERKLLVRVKHFRYVCINVPDREQQLFANAHVLTQLALFLLNVHRASGKWGGPIKPKPKAGGDDGDEQEEDEEQLAALQRAQHIVPLVLITRNPSQNCFLVVGITCPTEAGEVHRNTLGTAFRLAASETGANFRQDGFASAVLEIQMDDIQYFVEQLHNVLDA